MIRYDAIEQKARELCEADGRNPDAVDWTGDPEVIGGTCSWPIWKEYEEQARKELAEAEP